VGGLGQLAAGRSVPAVATPTAARAAASVTPILLAVDGGGRGSRIHTRFVGCLRCLDLGTPLVQRAIGRRWTAVLPVVVP
jgi:hypothetical protein